MGHCCERKHVVDLDSVFTTHRFRDEEIGGRGWGAPCPLLLDQAWNARWRKQATDCPAPPRRVLVLKGVRSTVGLVDVTCGRLHYSGLAADSRSRCPSRRKYEYQSRARRRATAS